LLEKLPTDGSDSEYKDLQVQINELAPDVGDTAWGHKYFSLLFPAKLDDYHNADYGRYHLIKLLQQIPLEPGRYVCAGRFVSIAKELSLPMNHLTTVLNEIDGNPHRYWRIGTREGDSGKSHWTSMRDGNYVSIGWSELNDLSELIHNQKSKDLLKGLMQERFYPNSPQTAGKKGTEVFRFATTLANGDIVVASDGSTVLGIGKVTGDYAYNSELPFAHIRAVEWLSKDEWKMKDREGLRTTVSEIKKPENLVEIERRIQGLLLTSDDSVNLTLRKDLIVAYSKAAKKIADGALTFKYLDFEGTKRRIESFKQLFNNFLADPNDSNLQAFWNKSYLETSVGPGSESSAAFPPVRGHHPRQVGPVTLIALCGARLTSFSISATALMSPLPFEARTRALAALSSPGSVSRMASSRSWRATLSSPYRYNSLSNHALKKEKNCR
jgi:hypothetical protein